MSMQVSEDYKVGSVEHEQTKSSNLSLIAQFGKEQKKFHEEFMQTLPSQLRFDINAGTRPMVKIGADARNKDSNPLLKRIFG
jgi:hypothetical protein